MAPDVTAGVARVLPLINGPSDTPHRFNIVLPLGCDVSTTQPTVSGQETGYSASCRKVGRSEPVDATPSDVNHFSKGLRSESIPDWHRSTNASKADVPSLINSA
jgi:hypothetical protein